MLRFAVRVIRPIGASPGRQIRAREHGVFKRHIHVGPESGNLPAQVGVLNGSAHSRVLGAAELSGVQASLVEVYPTSAIQDAPHVCGLAYFTFIPNGDWQPATTLIDSCCIDM
jgi:hypothetical protein